MRIQPTGTILLILLGCCAISSAYADQIVFLIRHAEPMRDVEDPPLTDAGQQRAKTWASIFRDVDLTVVYTSKKRRTMQTGEQIAKALNVPMKTMSRKDVHGLVDLVRKEHVDEAVLIVSHAWTIPKLVKAFGSMDDGSVSRDDDDNLFVIVPKEGDDVTVFRLRY